MAERHESVTFSVSEREKKAIRKASASRGISMAELARGATLDVVEAADWNAVDDPEPRRGHEVDPLDDFIESQLQIASDAQPVPKADVYQWYVAFCEDTYPGHDIESRHLFTRQLAGSGRGVEQGRAYVDGERARCFLNVMRTPQPKLNFD
jgi:hypothetical protein